MMLFTFSCCRVMFFYQLLALTYAYEKIIRKKKRENTKELFKTVRMMRTREETRGVVVEHREE